MVELKKINEDNYSECISLSVYDEQKKYVASNVFSLAQAWVFYDAMYPFAIYADEKMVGFVMLGFDKTKKAYDIMRFMIDAKYQKSGYGKAALLLAIKHLRDEFDAREVYLSFVPGNAVAEKLYGDMGFTRTGEIEGGEIVMRLIIA